MKIISSQKINILAKSNESFKDECDRAILRHSRKDWGIVDRNIVEENSVALCKQGEVFSAYRTYYGKIWVITNIKTGETIIMFPEEYRAGEKYGKKI